MTQPTKKPTEFAINMYCSILALLHQENLDHESIKELFKDQPPHIYFVVKRPRITFLPETFSITNEFIEIDYQVQRQQTFTKGHTKGRNYLGTSNASLVCEYPFNTYKIIDNANQEILQQGYVTTLLNSMYYYFEDRTFLDCEILYIGQSFGKEGSRNAIDRLKSHSTLQLIYSEAIKKNPDSEIWLALAAFEQLSFTVMDGHTKYTEEQLKRDEETFSDIFYKINYEGLDESQVVTFTEAALIKYFQPQYNKEYKDSFPNKEHTSFSECYELDINSVCFEMDTSDKILCSFYSPSVERSHLHMATFLLHSPEERRLFFDVF